MRTLGLCPGSCFPPEVLPQHWPPLLRWVRVPSPFPTIIARMQPSDSPCRVSMPPVCPRLCLTSRASVGSVHHIISSWGRPSGRLPPTARRSGSPVLRRPVPTTGRSGVSQVTGPSSSAVPQSSTPPVPLRLATSASGDAAFRVAEPLSIRDEHFEAAIPAAHPLA